MQAARRSLSIPPVIVTPPSSGPWTPDDLDNTTWSRQTSGNLNTHPVITWESLVGTTEANRQAANPNTPTVLTYNFLMSIPGTVSSGNSILSLPKGIFHAENGFNHGFVNTTMIGIGQGYADGVAGIIGAGSRSTPGAGGAQTTIMMSGSVSSPMTGGNLIQCNRVINPYFGGFNLIGTQTQGDSVYHGGLMLSNSPNAIVERMTFIGSAPGFNSAPPGETFQLNVYKSDNTLVQDCEFDGRDTSGNPTTASWGWNTCDNAVVKRCWYHDGVVGMLTFWETVNIYTEDYWCDRVGYAASGVSGNSHGINHEQSEGTIRHLRPHLYMRGGRSSGTRGGKHVTMNSVHADVGADFRIEEPNYEPLPTSSTGMFLLSAEDGYHVGSAGRYGMSDYATRYGYQYMDSDPIVIKNGVSLICSPQYVDNVAQPGGWNSKNPAAYYARTNG